MNRARLVAALETRVHTFELSTMKLLHTLETTPNPRGLADLCADSETCHCALPAAGVGQVMLFDALNLHALSTLEAHRGPLACLVLSSCGRLLATASDKGTVVRVHSFPQAQLLHTFRRGSLPATFLSLCFSPGVKVGERYEQSANLLCAASSTGTIHVWSLDAQRGAVPASAPVVRSASAVQLPLISGERGFAHIKLRTPPGCRCTVAIRDTLNENQPDQIKHSLYALTEQGAYYSYLLDPLCGGECTLQDERRVVPSM